ncbi:MAG: NAD(P)H-dependent oxidoreductase [Akkermansiaceae bacterium]|jgi:nitroreductase|nr:NAD(P)H-dependent oxidoreductase [Akkermansiaceae bacterium]
MHTLTTTDLVAALNWRYATKAFDPARKLPAATLDALLEALVLAPSSFGFQPWKFLVVESPALRARLRAESWDQPQVTDASHLIVVTVRETLTEAHMDEHLARTMAVRGVTAEALAPLRGMMLGFISRMSPEQQFVWNSRQAYIALGQLMTSAAVMGVDTCPLEGISTAAYDDILDLAGSGYRTVCACALGYRAADDKYAALPKVRFPREQIVQVVTAG